MMKSFTSFLCVILFAISSQEKKLRRKNYEGILLGMVCTDY